MIIFTQDNKRMLGTLMKATVELRQALTVQEYVVSFRQQVFKHFYMGSVLDEVLNVESSILKWSEFLSEDIQENKITDEVEIKVETSILQAVNNEIQMYRRKTLKY
ncbi:hypothetical protein Cpap_4029 [Ruminiclostridium papyrosolvens DSM 2782]|uniref:Uncharacterized protein n=1 Tax=Ruminiclostridium papyrosolvens DSM 2782 TaxID=588581 RepID=F1T7Z3_9FIRM|nr:hypothetical protein [Ruminiclostridium papyrosolvens]EGD49591.1 hypothetical protein Cpap_4029 [Ruminiclostridium papyrosolvens DSM 2782]WES33283.1 hypothetical protein P0092_16155 [Ruminiclostridium papyrosolvens DSM 2782]